MALKRTVVLLKAYADAQEATRREDGEVDSKGSAAYNMLTAAFTPSDQLSGDQNDLGQIFGSSQAVS